MANEKQTKAAAKSESKKSLHTIVEHWLSGCIDRANELGVTDKEFQGIYPTQTGFVLVYYR